MAENVNLDSVRVAALKRIDRSERNFKLAFYGAGLVEIAFVASFLLLLISTVSCYSIVVLGLVALGAYINRGIARLLKALELRPNVD